MKNKKGFTLIELLAVIVVLAIIALIATPIVMNTIKNAKKGAAERTADNYIKQVETAVAESRIDGTKIDNGTYIIDKDGNLFVLGLGLHERLEIDMNGAKPTSGTVTISNGGISQTGTTMTVGEYDVVYSNNKCTALTIVYRWSTDEINIGDTIDPSDTSKFTKDASTLGKNYYLKHVLDKDNKVTESYACLSLARGEICLRGGSSSFYGWSENEADYTGNMLMLSQSYFFFSMYGSGGSSESSYGIGPYDLKAYSDGSVGVGDNAEDLVICSVNDVGSSYCTSY